MKNQLSVIQGMAAQTARNAGSLKQFQKTFSERVQGLAVATDLLVSQRWTGAQLTELIQRQHMPFIPSADQLECNGPNVSISADATQTLGLTLHELATNAVKHGAWSASGGRVSVTWQFVTNGATGNNLRVTWLEQAGPAVLPPTRRGFGHVVIEKVAAQRVGVKSPPIMTPLRREVRGRETRVNQDENAPFLARRREGGARPELR
jgi:two-component sensor histidine kinase